MLYKEIARILGYFFLLFSVALLIPLGVAIYYQFFSIPEDHPQPHVVIDFVATLAICILLALIFLWVARKSKGIVYRREGIFAVVLIWFLTPAISAIPFLTSGALTNPFQAYFEMVSGYTTTGATILHAKAYDESGQEVQIKHTIPGLIDTNYIYYGTVKPVRNAEGQIEKEGIEALGKALLFWRSFTQWLGGVGIVVLFIAVLPAFGIGAKLLYQTEMAGPIKEGSAPRIKETAIQLWQIYLGLTILQIALLLLTNMELPLFEAVAITFSTLSTGGFSTQNTNIAGYHSSATEWVVIVFMLMGATNFTLYTYLIKRKFYRIIEPEFILYIILIALFSIGTVYGVYGFQGATGFTAIRDGVFQIVSAYTSTGFFTVNYDVWPYAIQSLMIIAMILNGMSGSTASGLKTIRTLMLFRIAQNRVESFFRPAHLKVLKIGAKDIDNTTINTVLCFFLILATIGTLGIFLFICDGLDPETAVGLTPCFITNTGLGFRAAGPLYSCAFLSDFSLVLSSLLMIFGRLEFFTVLAILVPAFWRQDA